jgi:hypothetical protein
MSPLGRPKGELLPLRGQRSGEAASVGAMSPLGRPKGELLPLWGQRGGEAASVGAVT